MAKRASRKALKRTKRTKRSRRQRGGAAPAPVYDNNQTDALLQYLNKLPPGSDIYANTMKISNEIRVYINKNANPNGLPGKEPPLFIGLRLNMDLFDTYYVLGKNVCDVLKNVNTNITYNGDNMLTWLAKNGDNRGTTEWLLSLASPPTMAYKSTAPDTNGLTAFEIATQKGNKIVVDALLKGYTYDPRYDLNAMNCGIEARQQEWDEHVLAYTAAQAEAEKASAAKATQEAAAAVAAAAKAKADAEAKAKADAEAKAAATPEESEWNSWKKAQNTSPASYLDQEDLDMLARQEEEQKVMDQQEKERVALEEQQQSSQKALMANAKFVGEAKQAENGMYKSYETPGQSQTNLGVQQQQQNSNAALAAGYEAQWGAPGAQGAGHAQETTPTQEAAPPAQEAAPAQWTPAMGTAQLDAMAAQAAKYTPPTYTPPVYTPPIYRSWFGFGGAPPLFLGSPVNAASSCTIPSGGARRRTKRRGNKKQRRATRRATR